MEWWDKVVLPVRRVWNGVASRLGIRQTGISKLRPVVKSCEYEDVHVLWEILKRQEAEKARLIRKNKKRCRWSFIQWARCAPYLHCP